MDRNIFIVHYNTPELTSALVRSINLHTKGTRITILDNSDVKPFTDEFPNVSVLDNTKGQLIDFEYVLSQYPLRHISGGSRNRWASAKHCYSIEWYIMNTEDPFMLMDSDILLKRDISPLFDDSVIYVGEVAGAVSSVSTQRVLPFMCYINVPMMKENLIRYFSGDRMHGLNGKTKEDKYDTGGSFFEDTAHLRHRDIVLDDYIVHYKAGSWDSSKKLTRQMTQDEWLKEHRRLWMGSNSKVVYTCITNGYDRLKEPKFVTEGFDYVCFTDDADLISGIWDIRPLPKETEGIPPNKKQRYVKINPHKVLPEYELSVWVDANIMLTGDINECMKTMCVGDCNVFVPMHPIRDCIYEEMRICASIGKDKIENMKPQIDRYLMEGYPEHNGLLQSNILIRRHMRHDCIRLMAAWWDELSMGSHRDQLSFNYALWKVRNVEVRYMDRHIYRSRWFDLLYKHDGDGKKPARTFVSESAARQVPRDTKEPSTPQKAAVMTTGRKRHEVNTAFDIPRSFVINDSAFRKIKKAFEEAEKEPLDKEELKKDPTASLIDGPKVSDRITRMLRKRR